MYQAGKKLSSTPYDEFTAHNNLLCKKFLTSYSTEGDCEKNTSLVRDEFLILWSKILCVPTNHSEPELRLLILNSACNCLYTILHGNECEDYIGLSVEILFQAVEQISIHHSIPQCEDNVCKDVNYRLVALTHRLVSKKLFKNSPENARELSLLLYGFILLSLMEKLKSEEFLKEMEFILLKNDGIFNCLSTTENRQTSRKCTLLLPAVFIEEFSCQHSIIIDLARVVMFNTPLWSNALTMQKVENPLLTSFLQVSSMKAQHSDVNSFHLTAELPRERHLQFAHYLLLSANCASEKKHWMAIKFLRYLWLNQVCTRIVTHPGVEKLLNNVY